MGLSFVNGHPDDLDLTDLLARSIAMLDDARRSFELASTALLTDASTDGVAQEVRDIDKRINRTEQELRRGLVRRVAEEKISDISPAIGFTLLVKKIERVGDHAKNILELTDQGVSLAGFDETEALVVEQQQVVALFVKASTLLSVPPPEPDEIRDFAEQVNGVIAICQARIDSYLDSDRPGREAAPLAIYNRFLRRVAANLLGVVRAWAEPSW